MSKIRILLIVFVFFLAVSLCHAQDSLKAKLTELEASSKVQQSASNSTFAERFNQSSFAKRFGLLETQLKKLEQAGKSRDSRISDVEALQKMLQETGTARDVKISELDRRLQAIETRVKARQPNETLLNRITELESRFEALVDQPTSSQTMGSSALLTAPANFVANAQIPADRQVISGVEAESLDNSTAVSEQSVSDPDDVNLWNRETLTNGFWGLNDSLADKGIEVAFGLTNIYQQNVQGGTSTHRKQGRYTGSYDLEISTDLEKLLGIEGGSLYTHTVGTWSRADIDTTSVGSVFGVNADAGGGGRRAMDVVEVWYEHVLLHDALRIRLGKFDITGGFECRGCPVSFDGSAFANDETAQFLNGALVNNPTIPFPDYGLGAILYYNPVEWWYASAGAMDAQADGRETGFNTTFHDEDYFFYVFETGVTPQFNSSNGPLQGAYRVGVWYDPQDKTRFSDSTIRRDDTGLYLSCDQVVRKENDVPEDTQGLGVFGRYGWASDAVNDITNFWSLGLQYQGLIEGRDDDVLGLGFAQGIFSDGAGYTDDHESALELYYNALVTPWLSISPSIQYVSNPGGDRSVSDAVVLGLRAQMAF